MKRILILFQLILLSFTISAQEITFSALLNAVNEQENNIFQKELLDNGFTQISADYGLMNPEKWAFEYNPLTQIANIWVYRYNNSKEFRRTVENTTVRVHTFGPDDPLHTYLSSKIKEFCIYERTFFHSTQDYYTNDYMHKSGASFSIYSIRGENVIKVSKSQKITLFP
jgi:hypothetical protein